MKRLMRGALLAVTLGVAATAMAGENDFVGYEYSKQQRRDYDRGFFFGAEAWFVNARNLHYEPAIAGAGVPAATGGVLIDVDYDHEASPRAFLGYAANRRIGRFTLSYWDFGDDATRSEVQTGPVFYATGTHPVRGVVGRDSLIASTDIDVELAEFEWRKDFGQGHKFTGFWTVALTSWEIEYATQALFYNAASPSDAVRVADFSSTRGTGIKVGVGGRYQFNDRFAMGGRVAVGFSSTEQDYSYIDENTASGTAVAFLERRDTELSTLQFEGDVYFNLRVAAGFDINWGYRYLNFEDALAEDRFVDSGGRFNSVEQSHGIAFEGPYVQLGVTTGVSKIDSDGDGVLDVYDDCPDTPAGAWVDESGCPRDLDEDGVYDGIDRCPGTQFGTRVDEWGCGVDSDGDGVPDGLDLCPNTPDCAHVDNRGCPRDSDGDGVGNGCDRCPDTHPDAEVDENGCGEPVVVDGDDDGDGVPNSRDRCPNTPRGVQVDHRGCERVFSMTLHFATDSAVIANRDRAELDRVASFLAADGGRFEIQGHTDSSGAYEHNQQLSDRRARSVMEYLVGRGVPGHSLVSVGYSENVPVASNDTVEGRALNRRVDVVRRRR
ncbi:MAG: OmpA family protein [Acidobacteriota bacterium]